MTWKQRSSKQCSKFPVRGSFWERLSGLFARRIRIHARMKELSALLIKAFSLLKQFAEAVCSADTVGETEAEMTQAELLKSKLPEAVEKIHAEKHRLVPDCSSCAAPCGRTEDYDVRRIIDAPPEIRTAKLCLVQSLLNTAVGRPFGDEKTFMCIARGIFMLGEDCTAEELNGSASEIENLRNASA